MSILLMKYPEVLLLVKGQYLVVDAAQGIEAQTLANVYLAIDNDLEIFPVLIKLIYQVQTLNV